VIHVLRERILLILYLFLYFWSDLDLNTDSVSYVGYDIIGYQYYSMRFEYSDMDTVSDVKYLNSDTDKFKRL